MISSTFPLPHLFVYNAKHIHKQIARDPVPTGFCGINISAIDEPSAQNSGQKEHLSLQYIHETQRQKRTQEMRNK